MSKKNKRIAIRTVDIAQPVKAIDSITEYHTLQLYVMLNNKLLGSFWIENKRKNLSASHIRQTIAENLALKVLNKPDNITDDALQAKIISLLSGDLVSEDTESRPPYWHIDLSKPLSAITDCKESASIDLAMYWETHFLGSLQIANVYQSVSLDRLREEIVKTLGLKLLYPEKSLGDNILWSQTLNQLERWLGTETKVSCEGLPLQIPVSVVVATRDRPENLRQCLEGITKQKTSRKLDIVVVDNNPDSGLTRPIVNEFSGVRIIEEQRKGLSYARNAGFAACTGDIAIATDDDVVIPPDWLEKLVSPFSRNDVMIVTGNVLPISLETKAEQYFEIYGGLGRGFEQFEVSMDWFESFHFKAIPTWRLGATANAAFRTCIFRDPAIGLLDERLGIGMPTGCSEDTYLFYKVLKSGHTLYYEPAAYLWHKHRSTMKAFRKQLYNYSKGGVAFHLLEFLQDGDLRGLVRIFIELPLIHLWRLKEWLLRRSEYPPSLLFLEILGNFMGFFALFRAGLRVKRWGKCTQMPYNVSPEQVQQDEKKGNDKDKARAAAIR